jgi:glycosyltransferase involved in cell wall biosynthesis
MISIVYPYRNRELLRIKKSLDSLQQQKNLDFKVIFVDYGSKFTLATEIRELVSKYNFATYHYIYSIHQPWSRSKAVNVGLKLVETDYVFVADIDIIFKNDFIDIVNGLIDSYKSYYFKVGFLSEKETLVKKDFSDYQISFSSEIGAQGLSLFPMQAIKAIQGFDEFLHFWGAEDVDIHNRLVKIGIESIFYNSQILLLHQWHESYRKSETTVLSYELQLTDVIKLNHQHLINNHEKEIIKVNAKNWGNTISELEFNELKSFDKKVILNNKIEVVTHFLFMELPGFQSGLLSVQFIEDDFKKSLKYKIKKIIGKKVPKYYTLKEINDKLLLHIISFYHQFPYTYKVSDDLKSISFKIKK